MHYPAIILGGISVSACIVHADDPDARSLKGRVEIEHRADHFKASTFLANPTTSEIEFACGRGNVAKTGEFAFRFGCGSVGLTPARFTPLPRQSMAPIMCVVPAGHEILYDEYYIGYPNLGPGTYPLSVIFSPTHKVRVAIETVLNVPPGVGDGLSRRSSDPKAESELLSRVLDQRYLSREGKEFGDNLSAAIQLTSFHARNCGYWRVILEEWRESDYRRERYYVDVIGRMLAHDAVGRDYKELPPEKQALVASSPGIILDDTVLPELLDRGRKLDNSFVDRSEERRVGKECRSRWSPYH